MKKTCFSITIILLFSFLAIDLRAQCENDIPQTPIGSNNNLSVPATNSIGQSFFATCDGYIQTISVTSIDIANDVTDATLRIFKLQPVLPRYDLIYTKTGVTIFGNGTTTIISTPNVPISDLSLIIPIDAGIYLFTLTSATSSLALKADDGGLNLGLAYEFGAAYTTAADVSVSPLNVSALGTALLNDLTFTITGSSFLPVELTAFKASRFGKQSQLQWTTASELDNQYFAIERGTDGKNFKEIGQVKGNGTSAVKHDYAFFDPTPAGGNNYYRLKQVDLNGTFTYSKIEHVLFKTLDEVLVYPNPTKGTLTIETSSIDNNQVTIMDVTGRVWLSKIFDNSATVVDMAPFPKGLYFVEYAADNQLVRKKVIKE